MARPLIILFTFFVTVLAQDTAWSWIWRRVPDDHEMDRGSGTKSCTDINHTKGLGFEFDAGDTYVCLLMYSEKGCPGEPNGYACHQLKRKATINILSYQVVSGDFEEDPSIISSTTASSSTSEPTTASSSSSSSSSKGTTFTTSGTTAPSSTADPSKSPPENESDEADNSSLSGGAIAGIVIGVLAVVAIIGILAFLVGRRRKKNTATAEPSNGISPFAGAKPAVKAAESFQSEKAELENRPQPESSPPGPVKWGGPSSPTEPDEPGPSPYTTRPPRGTPLAELSTSNQIVELDANDREEK